MIHRRSSKSIVMGLADGMSMMLGKLSQDNPLIKSEVPAPIRGGLMERIRRAWGSIPKFCSARRDFIMPVSILYEDNL